MLNSKDFFFIFIIIIKNLYNKFDFFRKIIYLFF